MTSTTQSGTIGDLMKNTNNKQQSLAKLVLAAGIMFMLLAANTSLASASNEKKESGHKVTICHRTNSETNPYVQISVDFHAVDGYVVNDGSDHTHHDGPVFSEGLKDTGTKWGDIIPPFEIGDVSYEGQNWTDAGIAIYNKGCSVGRPPVTEPPTTQPPTTEPPTTLPPTTEPPVTEPPVTEPPTTTPPVDSTVPPAPTTPAVQPPEIGTPNTISRLPDTGATTAWLAALGFALLASGTIMVLRARGARRELDPIPVDTWDI